MTPCAKNINQVPELQKISFPLTDNTPFDMMHFVSVPRNKAHFIARPHEMQH